ncbi:TetR family transcriptional regulator [Rhodococcus sp. HNM0569]|uniref:TetR family transcriptional regulator n=1 Tax=Rhodococcus sp. HNM0569 TaxID=2716340 RepID=UPI00146A9F2F|nr:TetR family transcriptional regulator [Rhodococcus sp. HNM0569]NLU81652.1 TetR/AcrR family transcriptional regulator [Rhodococcus sp. HNM0569]
MPRIATARDAAEPSSQEQHARHERILDAAARLATETELQRVQMHEVAKEAGVAIGTLYRYFPSKTHLFVAVMVNQIEQMSYSLVRHPAAVTSAQDGVYDILMRATRALLRRPALSNAMIQSTSAANVTLVPDAGRVDALFHRLLLDAARIEQPTDDESTALRLLVRLWFGVVQSCLNGRASVADAESDIRRGCDLLLVALDR